MKPRIRVQAGDSRGVSARAVRRGGVSSYHSGALSGQAVAGWNPLLLSGDRHWLPERDISIARIRDMERNEGWTQSALDKQVDMLVGGTFRLSARPDAHALGISEEAATDLRAAIHTKWRATAEDPTFRFDSQRRMSFAAQMGLIARHLMRDGEGLAVLNWRPRHNWPYATCVQIVDPDRLETPPEHSLRDDIRGGVEHDEDGAPIAYWLRNGHPSDFESYGHDRIERWEDVYGWERPRVLHVMDPIRADQARGVSKLAAALVKTRLLSRHAEAEVKAAALNASIVGAIYSELGQTWAEEVLSDGEKGINFDGMTDARVKFYENRPVMDDARFVTLFPSDKLEMNTAARNVTGFPQFQKAFLQSFAASLNITYEQLSSDWSGVNYSSARAALNEVYRFVRRVQLLLAAAIATPIYTAWLEDALATGEIEIPAGAPDFYDAPAAYVRCEWIGPARGYVDPVKEIQAAKMRVDSGLSSYEHEAAEQGKDWDILRETIRREQQALTDSGIVITGISPPALDTEDPDERDARERRESGAA